MKNIHLGISYLPFPSFKGLYWKRRACLWGCCAWRRGTFWQEITTLPQAAFLLLVFLLITHSLCSWNLEFLSDIGLCLKKENVDKAGIAQPARLCRQRPAWATWPCRCEAGDQHQSWVEGLGVEPWKITAVGTEGPQLPMTLGGSSDAHQIAAPWSYLSGPSYAWRYLCGISHHNKVLFCAVPFSSGDYSIKHWGVGFFSFLWKMEYLHFITKPVAGNAYLGLFLLCVELACFLTASALASCCFEWQGLFALHFSITK